MHGVVFAELKKYVEVRLGAAAWPALLERAGLKKKIFLVSSSYPDEEASRLVRTASELTGKPAPAILEDFGEFLFPDLIKMYAALAQPQWKTLEVLENLESTMHRVVRLRDSNAAPPEILCKRDHARQVTVIYRSQRRLCALARGLIRGVAAHYGQRVDVHEPSCMLLGRPQCELEVALTA